MQIHPYVLKIGRVFARRLDSMATKLNADTRLFASKGKQGTYAHEYASVTAVKIGGKIIFTLEINSSRGREKLQSPLAKEVIAEMKQFAPMNKWLPME